MTNDNTESSGDSGRGEVEIAAIRAWAQYAGKDVPTEGPLPQEIIAEFYANAKD